MHDKTLYCCYVNFSLLCVTFNLINQNSFLLSSETCKFLLTTKINKKAVDIIYKIVRVPHF